MKKLVCSQCGYVAEDEDAEGLNDGETCPECETGVMVAEDKHLPADVDPASDDSLPPGPVFQAFTPT